MPFMKHRVELFAGWAAICIKLRTMQNTTTDLFVSLRLRRLVTSAFKRRDWLNYYIITDGDDDAKESAHSGGWFRTTWMMFPGRKRGVCFDSAICESRGWTKLLLASFSPRTIRSDASLVDCDVVTSSSPRQPQHMTLRPITFHWNNPQRRRQTYPQTPLVEIRSDSDFKKTWPYFLGSIPTVATRRDTAAVGIATAERLTTSAVAS